MAELKNKAIRVEVGKEGEPGRAWSGLRVQFKVEKDDTRSPDKAKIQIWGLSKDSRGFVQQADNVTQLFAGYGDNPALLFRGDVLEDSVRIVEDLPEIVTEFDGRDGFRAWSRTKLFRTYAGPIDTATLVQRIATELGVPSPALPTGLGSVTYQEYTIAGPVRHSLAEILSAVDARGSIQDGEMLITRIGVDPQTEAVILRPGEGLVGSPQLTDTGIKATALLDNRIRPRRPVVLESSRISGRYIVKKATYSGDSYSDDNMAVDFEAVEI